MTAKWCQCFHWRIRRPQADSSVPCVRPRRCAGNCAKPLSSTKLALLAEPVGQRVSHARPSSSIGRDELLFVVLESLASLGYVRAMHTKSFVQLLASNM
jgi:hypothetical protein